MGDSTEPSAGNQINPSETVELHGIFEADSDLKEENFATEKSFGDFLRPFEALKLESEDIAKNVSETGDLSNAPARSTYEEQLESAMNMMGLTMDDYLNARSVWSGDTAFDENVNTACSVSDQELSKLGLNEEEIREINETTALQMEREKARDSLSNKRDPMSQLLSANFDAVSSERGKFQKILEDIRKDTEYIREIPKWQLEMQKRLDMLKQMRLDMEADFRKRREEGIKDDMDIKSEIERRVAELTACVQGEKTQNEKLEKAQSSTPLTSDDKGDYGA